DAKPHSEGSENLLQSVRLMLKQEDLPPSSDLSRPALVDAVRLMQGLKPIATEAELKAFAPGIARIRELLGKQQSFEEDEAAPRRLFSELELRAARWMSPLVQRLDVGMRSPRLHGLQLVDLPGMNNFQDAG